MISPPEMPLIRVGKQASGFMVQVIVASSAVTRRSDRFWRRKAALRMTVPTTHNGNVVSSIIPGRRDHQWVADLEQHGDAAEHDRYRYRETQAFGPWISLRDPARSSKIRST